MSKTGKIAAAGILLLILIGLTLIIQTRSKGILEKQTRIGACEVRVYRSRHLPSFLYRIAGRMPNSISRLLYRLEKPDVALLEIRHYGQVIFQWPGHRFSFVGDEQTGQINRDLNGDGSPDLAVEEYSGGAHCCYTLHLFDCGDKPRKYISIEGAHGQVEIRDLDHDEAFELILNDWTYAYWPAGFVSSPAPQVVLRWTGRHYRPAPDLMRKAAPSDEEFQSAVNRIRASEDWDDETVPPDLFSYALDLMYSGHEALGFQFIRDAWQPGRSIEPLMTELRDLMEKSPYWPEIRER